MRLTPPAGRSDGDRPSPRAAGQAVPAGDATAAIGAGRGVPEPSRRPVAGGRSTGLPLPPLARVGVAPAQPSTSTSSPRRNRWHRTPPVARPLLGYSVNG